MLFDAEAVAGMLRVKPQKVYRLVEQGQLHPHPKIDQRTLFTFGEVCRFAGEPFSLAEIDRALRSTNRRAVEQRG